MEFKVPASESYVICFDNLSFPLQNTKFAFEIKSHPINNTWLRISLNVLKKDQRSYVYTVIQHSEC